MSDLTRAYAEKVVTTWQKRMRLQHWELSVEFHEDGVMPDDLIEGVHAWCSIGNDDYCRATIGFGEGWAQRSKRELNLSACHELMHIVARDLVTAAETMNNQDWVPKDIWWLIDKRLDHEHERMVDHMAYVLVDIGGVV